MTQPNTSPLPTLRAAVEAHERFLHFSSERHKGNVDFTQSLSTFNGCTYQLRFRAYTAQRVSCAAGMESRAPHSSSSSTQDNMKALTGGFADDLSGATMMPSDESDVLHRAAAIRLAFTHAIPMDQLNTFNNCQASLSQRLQEVAPHCTLTVAERAGEEDAPDNAFVLLDIPAEVPAAERDAGLVWAASLPVVSLLPVLSGLLQRSRVTGERHTLVLLPPSEGPPGDVSVSFSRLTRGLILCATPVPSSTSVAHGSTTTPPGEMDVAVPFFEGAVSLITCVTSRHAREAALLRSYLDAFTAKDAAAGDVFLAVRESLQPPTELQIPSLPVSSPADPPYVWWCTMMLGPQHLRTPGGLERAVQRSLQLRPTLLFHVHRESVALHALLRQQLRAYAARFA